MAVLVPRETPKTWKLQEVLVTEPGTIKRAIGAAAVGNITEWYDFGVYAYFEPTLRKVFFSGLDEAVGTIATFGLFAVAFLIPPESLILDPLWLRYLLAAAVAFAPVFFANLVFTYSFRDIATADMAFASNLLGAMLGGALEYVALITGYRVLLLVVAALYALAWLFANRWRFLSDVDLATATPAGLPAAGGVTGTVAS